MVRHLTIIIAVLGCLCPALHAAEALPVRAFEAEIGGGITVPIDANYHDADRMIGPTFDLEMRYNFSNTPWACGILIGLDWATWDFNHNGEYSRHNRMLRFGLLGEYNFRQGHRVNPFASLGWCLGIPSSIGDAPTGSTSSGHVFVPKVGVEFYRWLRLNAFFQLSRKGYNVFGLTVGLTIGGRPKQ